MRNYYAQIHEYLQRLIRNIITLDKKGLHIKGYNFSITDVLLIKLLGVEKEKKMFEVIDSLNMDRNTFKTMMNQLISEGYVQKKRSAEDKRAYVLELTDKGYLAFEDIVQNEKDMVFSLLDDFTFNEEKAILKFLVKLDMLNRERK